MFTRCLHTREPSWRNDRRLMFAKELAHAGHTRKFSIQGALASGWEVRDEQDNRILKQVRYTDWHRVERALSMFALQIEALEEEGWVAPLTR